MNVSNTDDGFSNFEVPKAGEEIEDQEQQRQLPPHEQQRGNIGVESYETMSGRQLFEPGEIQTTGGNMIMHTESETKIQVDGTNGSSNSDDLARTDSLPEDESLIAQGKDTTAAAMSPAITVVDESTKYQDQSQMQQPQPQQQQHQEETSIVDVVEQNQKLKDSAGAADQVHEQVDHGKEMLVAEPTNDGVHSDGTSETVDDSSLHVPPQMSSLEGVTPGLVPILNAATAESDGIAVGSYESASLTAETVPVHADDYVETTSSATNDPLNHGVTREDGNPSPPDVPPEEGKDGSGIASSSDNCSTFGEQRAPQQQQQPGPLSASVPGPESVTNEGALDQQTPVPPRAALMNDTIPTEEEALLPPPPLLARAEGSPLVASVEGAPTPLDFSVGEVPPPPQTTLTSVPSPIDMPLIDHFVNGNAVGQVPPISAMMNSTISVKEVAVVPPPSPLQASVPHMDFSEEEVPPPPPTIFSSVPLTTENMSGGQCADGNVAEEVPARTSLQANSNSGAIPEYTSPVKYNSDQSLQMPSPCVETNVSPVQARVSSNDALAEEEIVPAKTVFTSVPSPTAVELMEQLVKDECRPQRQYQEPVSVALTTAISEERQQLSNNAPSAPSNPTSENPAIDTESHHSESEGSKTLCLSSECLKTQEKTLDSPGKDSLNTLEKHTLVKAPRKGCGTVYENDKREKGEESDSAAVDDDVADMLPGDLPLPTNLRRSTISTPGAFHEGGGGMRVSATSSFHTQDATASTRSIPAETDPAVAVESLALSTITGIGDENTTLITATLVVDGDDDTSRDDEGVKELAAMEKLVLAHAQPIHNRRRRIACIVVIVLLCIIGLVVGLVIALTQDDNAVIPERNFTDIQQRLRNTTYQTLYVATWGSETHCTNNAVPPLDITCGDGASSTALAVPLRDEESEAIDDRPPICKNAGYEKLECMKPIPVEEQFRNLTYGIYSNQVKSTKFSQSIIFACAGDKLEDLKVSVQARSSVAESCGVNFMSTDRVKFYGGATMEYITLQRICPSQNGDELLRNDESSAAWVLQHPESCEQGDELPYNDIQGRESPVICSATQACVSDQTCHRGDSSPCGASTCNGVLDSIRSSLAPRSGSANECTLPPTWSPSSNDISAMKMVIEDQLPPQSEFHSAFDSLLDGYATVSADNAAIVTAFDYQTTYGIAWGTIVRGCESYPVSPNMTIQCGQQDGVISLSSASSDVSCDRTGDNELLCYVLERSDLSSHVAVVCGGNKNEDLALLSSTPASTIQDCGQDLYIQSTACFDEDRAFGGSGGVYMNLGRFCFDESDTWRLQTNGFDCLPGNSTGHRNCHSIGSCKAVQQCNDISGSCTGNATCVAPVASLSASFPDKYVECARSTKSISNAVPPANTQQNLMENALEKVGLDALDSDVKDEIDRLSTEPEIVAEPCADPDRNPGSTLPPTPAPDLILKSTAHSSNMTGNESKLERDDGMTEGKNRILMTGRAHEKEGASLRDNRRSNIRRRTF